MIVTDDGRKRAAILKRGDLSQVAAEYFAAVLLRQWNLTVPEPFLIQEADRISFASLDAGFPNLKQYLYPVEMPSGPARDAVVNLAMKIASCLKTAPLAAACDEAINNRDRNLGNILWDGQEEVWIDHANSFGLGAMPDVNKICMMAVQTGETTKMQRSALAASLLIDRRAPDLVQEKLQGSPIEAFEFAKFVVSRVAQLSNLLLLRFPEPNDLLAGIKR